MESFQVFRNGLLASLLIRLLICFELLVPRARGDNLALSRGYNTNVFKQTWQIWYQFVPIFFFLKTINIKGLVISPSIRIAKLTQAATLCTINSPSKNSVVVVAVTFDEADMSAMFVMDDIDPCTMI